MIRRTLPWLAVLVTGCDGVFKLIEVEEESTPDAAMLPPDLVAYLPMETLADNATDELAHDLDGVCARSECPVPVAGAVGGALAFDGVDDLLHVPTAIALETVSGFTVTAWVMQTADLTTDDAGCMFNKRFGSGIQNTWQLCFGAGSATQLVFVSVDGVTAGVGNWLIVPDAFPHDEWHHVAIRFDGSIKSVWIDGVQKASSTAQVGFDGGEVLIGADIDSGSTNAPFPGAIDEVRLYDRALTGTEILFLAR